MIYRLVTIGEAVQITLHTAESSERSVAVKELRSWAKRNSWTVQRNPEHEDADCVIQSLELIN